MEATETAKDTETAENLDQDVEVEKEEESAGAPADDDSTKETAAEAQDQEFEVVRESKGSQPKSAKNVGVQKRINKLNAKIASEKQVGEQANSDLAVANERLKIQQLRLDQMEEAQTQPAKSAAPKPEDFDDGVYDPAYQDAIIERKVGERAQKIAQQSVQTNAKTAQAQDLERKQIKHYDRVNETGAKDYEEVEDKAIDIFGKDTVNTIISSFDDAHILLYYLGKNPGEAARIAEKIQPGNHSLLVQGIAELGALRSELKVKRKSNTTPDPDEELEGGNVSAHESSQRKLDKLRDQVGKDPSQKNMMKIRDFKKIQKEKGIHLE